MTRAKDFQKNVILIHDPYLCVLLFILNLGHVFHRNKLIDKHRCHVARIRACSGELDFARKRLQYNLRLGQNRLLKSPSKSTAASQTWTPSVSFDKYEGIPVDLTIPKYVKIDLL
jgi:hypothetical protein